MFISKRVSDADRLRASRLFSRRLNCPDKGQTVCYNYFFAVGVLTLLQVFHQLHHVGQWYFSFGLNVQQKGLLICFSSTLFHSIGNKLLDGVSPLLLLELIREDDFLNFPVIMGFLFVLNHAHIFCFKLTAFH